MGSAASGRRHVLFTLASGTASDRWIERASSSSRLRLEPGRRSWTVERRALLADRPPRLRAGRRALRRAFDARRQALTGPAVRVVEGVSRATSSLTGAAHYSVSETGTLVYIPGPLDASAGLGERMQMVWSIETASSIDCRCRPTHIRRLASLRTEPASPSALDDGKEAIVWIYDLFGNAPRRRLTFGATTGFRCGRRMEKRWCFNPTARRMRRYSRRRATAAKRRTYDITPAGKFVARISPGSEPYGTVVEPIQIVVNWFEELRAMVTVSR